MYIAPVTNVKYYNAPMNKPQVSFTAHSDSYRFNSTASCFFRRGAVLLVNSKGYADIENLFVEIFKANENQPKKMLIAGIGNSQEPFSYLASIKGIIEGKKLSEILDLHIVDLQSKPEERKLKKDSFCSLFEYEICPKYAKKSIVKDSYFDWLGIKKNVDSLEPVQKYIYEMFHKASSNEKKLYERVNNEVFEFLNKVYNDPQKSKWNSPIQEVVTDYPNKKFDVVSANNVLPYIIDENKIIQTIHQIKRVLKTGGYFITDPYPYPQKYIDAGVLDNFKEVYKGIYQKIV